MEAKRGRIIVTAICMGMLAATSIAMTGCDLSETGDADLSSYRTGTELAGSPASYFRGLLSMDVLEDLGIGSPPE